MNDKIAKAKAGLIIDQPFFASILLPMPITEDPTVKTMATDGESIVFNPKWVETLTLSEVTFVLAHETLHCVFQHMCRLGNKNKKKYNIAADYVINDLLVKEKVGVMPKIGLHDPALVQKGEGTAEGVYRLLPDEAGEKGPGEPGGAMDEVREAGSEQGAKPVDESTRAQKESEIRVRVIQAKNAAKMQGKMSANLERLINDIVKTKTDWRTVLRRFLTERAKTEYSYARPKRRFLAEDIYLPSLQGDKIGKIVVAVDCSGSIGEEELNYFGAEIKAIFEDTNPSEVSVLYFDSEYLKTQVFQHGDTVELEAVGGGGTAFSPIFKEIIKWDEQPTACVVLTDLCCNDFGEAPEYPVLWASTHKDSGAPFGEIIKIGEDL